PEKLLPFLTARISYPVIIPDLKTLVGFKNEEDFLRVQKTGGSEFIVPIGLALLCGNGLQDPLFCDISKHILVEKASVRLKIITTVMLLIIVNGVAVYLYPFFSSMLKNLTVNLSNTEKRIEIVSKEAENTEKIKKELSEAKDTLGKYEIVESALKNRVITSMLISELKEKLPQGVEIVNVSIDGSGNISVSGLGKSFKNVLDYEINLSSAKFVEGASIYDMAKSGSGTVIFRMSARVKGVSNEKK
ncbi:MAG: hypothetical protein J7L03_05380, partial [Caldisericaceae bacterium]|nr:hypothetical protein [Caldisericaceae bacterium]